MIGIIPRGLGMKSSASCIMDSSSMRRGKDSKANGHSLDTSRIVNNT